MTLNCVIIDNEQTAKELLAGYVSKTPFLKLVGSYTSPLEAIKVLHNENIDLIFLETELQEMSGIEFTRILSPSTKIVFTTSTAKYAIDAFKVNAVDYLLKPLTFDAFMETVRKCYKMQVKEEEKERINEFLFIKNDYKLTKVFFDDILYINGQKDYVKFYMTDGSTITSLLNMKNIEDKLPKSLFLRVHRSYIINTKKIGMIDKFRFVIGNEFIPISETYKQDVTDFINSHTIS